MARPRQVPREGASAITVYALGHPENDPRERPTREQVLKYIHHPGAIRGFDRDGKAVWPADQFTQRRIRDGDVTTEAPKEAPRATKRVEHKAAQ